MVVTERDDKIPGVGAFGATVTLTRRFLDLIVEAGAREGAGRFLRGIGCERELDWAGRAEERMGTLRLMEGSAGHQGLPRGYYEWCLEVANRATAETRGPDFRPKIGQTPRPDPIGAERSSTFSPVPRSLWRQKRIGGSPIWDGPALLP
jgi:hypothetical protein